MSYDDAINAIVTRKEAFAEVIRHGHPISEFVREVGNKWHYSGAEVLEWLGY